MCGNIDLLSAGLLRECAISADTSQNSYPEFFIPSLTYFSGRSFWGLNWLSEDWLMEGARTSLKPWRSRFLILTLIHMSQRLEFFFFFYFKRWIWPVSYKWLISWVFHKSNCNITIFLAFTVVQCSHGTITLYLI